MLSEKQKFLPSFLFIFLFLNKGAVYQESFHLALFNFWNLKQSDMRRDFYFMIVVFLITLIFS
jgi:hypothetical protein